MLKFSENPTSILDTNSCLFNGRSLTLDSSNILPFYYLFINLSHEFFIYKSAILIPPNWVFVSNV